MTWNISEVPMPKDVMIAGRRPWTIDWRMTIARSAPGETMAKEKIAISDASSRRYWLMSL
ncbi:hypothetical protein D3C86_2023200 [compost metagenome]